jgi:hypothetical protein
MAKFSRKGLHRLECSSPTCDGFAYNTIASMERALERHGRILVCACGEEMRPERIDVVLALGLDELVDRELRQRTQNSENSQHRSLGRNKLEMKRSAGTLNDMLAKTIDDMRHEQAEVARRRRSRGRAISAPIQAMPF